VKKSAMDGAFDKALRIVLTVGLNELCSRSTTDDELMGLEGIEHQDSILLLSLLISNQILEKREGGYSLSVPAESLLLAQVYAATAPASDKPTSAFDRYYLTMIDKANAAVVADLEQHTLASTLDELISATRGCCA
jgi:DNA-binding IscR family transcriptional regulator